MQNALIAAAGRLLRLKRAECLPVRYIRIDLTGAAQRAYRIPILRKERPLAGVLQKNFSGRVVRIGTGNVRPSCAIVERKIFEKSRKIPDFGLD